jgi:hypothetical protein
MTVPNLNNVLLINKTTTLTVITAVRCFFGLFCLHSIYQYLTRAFDTACSTIQTNA